jgi:elongator complex protein 3
VNDTRFRFEPALHERELAAIITEIEASPELDLGTLDRILRRHPRGGVGLFAKTEIVRGARHLAARGALAVDPDALARRLRTAPVRSHSGILPVTVLTRPHPCPGRCVFCPSDARMPKSYLASEPGAQRAEQHGFDPYRQTRARLEAFRSMGHPLDKVELIVLGGTWSAYPLAYRLWFVQRCLEALCDFGVDGRPPDASAAPFGSFEALPAAARGVYNETVSAHLRARQAGRLRAPEEEASWDDLARAQQRNEEAAVRCVGLSLETRPDEVDADEVLCLRRLGATKIQLGIQSLSDEVLHRNQRGHDVAATREAMTLLRGAGFKLHAHWMPNLLGSTPEADLADFERLFADPAIRPDELKLYPCSLVESAELMDHQRAGAWRPYADDELLHVVSEAMRRTPRWCRLTRVVRDIPSPDIVVGNKRTNFREVAETDLRRRGVLLSDVRTREIRDESFDPRDLILRETRYGTAVGTECFLELTTPEDRLVAFARLSLPEQRSFVSELGGNAVLRELHVYGPAAALGEASQGRPQHGGLGRRLIDAACERAAARGYPSLAVISSTGTRGYYRRLGFRDGALYQHLALGD